MSVWTTSLLAFSALLPIINPLGSALVFLGLVGKAPPALYRSQARRIAVNNFSAMVIKGAPGLGVHVTEMTRELEVNPSGLARLAELTELENSQVSEVP